MVIAIIAIIVLVIIIIAAVGSTSTSSYTAIVSRHYNKMLSVFKSTPFRGRAADELGPMLYVVGDLFLTMAKLDRTSFASQFPQTISGDAWNKRMKFYADIIHYGYVWGQWSFSEIPDDVKDNPFARCAIACGDLMLNEECLDDYENAPLTVFDISYMVAFNSAMTKLMTYINPYLDDLVKCAKRKQK